MKILALDSSGLVAGVAVTENDNLLGEYTINYKKTHSQTLLPMLDEVAKMIELDLNTIDVIGSVRRTWIFYGTQDRLCDGQGTRSCPEQTDCFRADGGCPGI